MASKNEELKKTCCPDGKRDAIGALGMTEPSGGSDVQNIKTRAIKDGDHYVVTDKKYSISNGICCDFVVLATKTDPAARAKGISLILVEADRAGFNKGRNLEKIGAHAADLAELFFADVHVPATNLVSEEGAASACYGPPRARAACPAIRSTSVCEAVIDWTINITSERKAFGQTIGDFQNTQFVLAQLHTETTAARIFTDWSIRRFMDGTLSPSTRPRSNCSHQRCRAKWWIAACSSSAATVTCGNIRLLAHSWIRGWFALVAEPWKS